MSDVKQRFYLSEKLSPKMSKTPEGFLLCQDVPIARTGSMQYTEEEIPLQGDSRGVVTIIRDEKEVFRPEFINSFNGKPVVDDHPPEDVSPRNWAQYAKGFTLNPRRGAPPMDSFLFADLLICDQETIEEVLSGKREVSCGYDAEYEQTADGIGRQFNMLGNHVALVDAGRCGPRCAIGDRKSIKTGDCSMATKPKRQAWLDRLAEKIRKAVQSKDEAAVEEIIADAEVMAESGVDNEPLNINLDFESAGEEKTSSLDADLEARFQSIEDSISELRDSIASLVNSNPSGDNLDPKLMGGQDEMAEGSADLEVTDEDIMEEVSTGDRAIVKARDSAPLADTFQDVVSKAEILVPGIRLPTFDSAAPIRHTMDSLCKLRKATLDLAYHRGETRGVIDELIGGGELKLAKMSCRDARVLFNAAAGIVKQANSRDHFSSARRGPSAGGGIGVTGRIKTPAELNAKLQEYYSKKTA